MEWNDRYKKMLNTYRVNRGWSQQDMADELERMTKMQCSKNQITLWENTEKNASPQPDEFNEMIKAGWLSESDALVTCCGLLWKREYVDWDNHQMIGVAEGSDRHVNFWKQIGIYILYYGDKPVYVGQAGKQRDETETPQSYIGSRLKAHMNGDLSERWDRFSWFGLKAAYNGGLTAMPPSRTVDSYSEMHLLEFILISVFPYLENKQRGNMGKIGLNRFYQYEDMSVYAKNNREFHIISEMKKQLGEVLSRLSSAKGNDLPDNDNSMKHVTAAVAPAKRRGRPPKVR